MAHPHSRLPWLHNASHSNDNKVLEGAALRRYEQLKRFMLGKQCTYSERDVVGWINGALDQLGITDLERRTTLWAFLWNAELFRRITT